MATLLPPPKRQKLYHGHAPPAPDHTASSDTPKPNVIVQFVSEDSGEALAPAVSIPADLTREAMEGLLNKLKPEEDPVPFAFHVLLPDSESKEKSSGPTRIPIGASIYADILSHPLNSNHFTDEDVFIVHCAPAERLPRHGSPILCASFSPTGTLLATGAGDTTARLWNIDTELPSHTLAGHKGWVLCVEWEAMERKLATGGHDGHVIIWDPKTGKQIGDALKGHSKWIMSLCWEPIHLNPTSPRLASSSKDGTVRVWSLLTRRVEFTLGGHTASVNVVKWGGVGQGVLYTASSDRTVRIWDAQSGRQLHVLKDHAHWVTTLALNTDFVLRTGPFDHTGAKPVSDTDAQQRALARYTAVLNTTPELLISGSDDHTLFLWSPFPAGQAQAQAQAQTKIKPTARLVGHSLQVSHVSFSPDGRHAASASFDSSVRLWEGRTGKYVATLRGHVGAVYRVAWSADGRAVVSCGKDSTVKTWNLKTYKLNNDLPGHTDEVYCVDFVADKIVSGGRDRTVKIWKN
ncbi:WD repeat protein [Mycena kentingensis (nom. inval.)]|nr:WD repeat protein [Mycena kentingensis (nom. inval.)]